MTELRDLLKRRRMVRSYLRDPIDDEAIDWIVDFVLRAPSGGFIRQRVPLEQLVHRERW